MLKHFGNEERGILSYMELTDMKFIPRRMYYISKVPKGAIRGGHGHYEDQQYIFCIKGQIKVYMFSKNNLLILTSTAKDLSKLGEKSSALTPFIS